MSNFSWMLFEKFDWIQKEWKLIQKHFFLQKMQLKISTTQHLKNSKQLQKIRNEWKNSGKFELHF